ncbi:MAG TPA: polysaccharide biosynthesis/export family protein [Bryobacteraceae bacterium]|jgi:polysaccharide export outer membrane protein|nr:polysaccharide biosynthesis/export family protein [Bryobacteraceae bacterium]
MKLLVMSLWLAAGLVSGQVRQTAPAEISGSNLPIQPIGANDLVAIAVYDGPEFTRTVRVGADGYLRLPMLKQRIQATGLMPAELETTIGDALKQEGLIVDPFVTVTVAEYNSRPIAVMGAVRRPLTFQAAGPVTLLDALARAEGLSPEAGSEILVSRQQITVDGKTSSLTQRIPVKVLIDGASSDLNLRLTGGEEIRVPEVGKVYVLGNVKKPGAYTAQQNPETSVLKALAMAEGLLPYSAKRVYIYRREASGNRSDIEVDLGKMMDRKSPDIPLLANDILYIPDAKGTRAGIALLEKVLLFGSGAMSALIYAGVR